MARTGNPTPDDLPIALAREGTHGPVVHATNRAGRLAGIVEGARVVDMRSVCPELKVEYADLAGDRVALERLMLWARRWCPWSVVDGAGLILDTTGSDHLWGGEAAMLEEMEMRLSLLGLTARLAIAPTWGAAWALARYGRERAICPADALDAQLAPLPAAGLRLDADTLLLLQRLGLKTIGAIARVPRLSLTRRFVRAGLEANPVLRLDQAMGRQAEPVSSVEARPPLRVRAMLPEPIQDPTHHLPGLCEALCADLAAAGLGARRLLLTVYRTDGEVSDVALATAAASRDAAHLCRLFDGTLERINPGFGFDLITLEAPVTEPIKPLQKRLRGEAQDALELPQLIDRLSARFGPRAVKQPVLRTSHVPERVEGWRSGLIADLDPARTAPRGSTLRREAEAGPPLAVDAITRRDPRPGMSAQISEARAAQQANRDPQELGGEPSRAGPLSQDERAAQARRRAALARAERMRQAETARVTPPERPRPLRLFDPAEEVRVLYAVPEGPPAQFIWRGQTHRVARYAGPERIAPEWWQDLPGTRLRDYFRVEDAGGRRLWLYREGLLEDGRGGAPRWFVQGVFA
ncbi:MAG: DUF6504 family protein [Pseudomonadota bacterium]